ncbi:hypothetical protein H311_03350 [Anncaliia algerae PRA109]|nr:hypothetical protein H311_03350 [Anncaliia algerae PRA109]
MLCEYICINDKIINPLNEKDLEKGQYIRFTKVIKKLQNLTNEETINSNDTMLRRNSSFFIKTIENINNENNNDFGTEIVYIKNNFNIKTKIVDYLFKPLINSFLNYENLKKIYQFLNYFR